MCAKALRCHAVYAHQGHSYGNPWVFHRLDLHKQSRLMVSMLSKKITLHLTKQVACSAAFRQRLLHRTCMELRLLCSHKAWRESIKVALKRIIIKFNACIMIIHLRYYLFVGMNKSLCTSRWSCRPFLQQSEFPGLCGLLYFAQSKALGMPGVQRIPRARTEFEFDHG